MRGLCCCQPPSASRASGCRRRAGRSPEATGRPGNPAGTNPTVLPLELDARVPACGNLGVAGRQVSVGLPLAGHTVTLRLEAATMHVLADGALVRSLPSPIQAAAPAKPHGARLARGGLVVPQGPSRGPPKGLPAWPAPGRR
jgi:hypothetical protein